MPICGTVKTIPTKRQTLRSKPMLNQIKKYAEIVRLALLQEKNASTDKIKNMNGLEREFLPAVLEVTETTPYPAA